jgi:hypothetical protein
VFAGPEIQLAQMRQLENEQVKTARQIKPVWQCTAALLMEAHGSGKPDDLQHATGQLRRALDAEGWAA